MAKKKVKLHRKSKNYNNKIESLKILDVRLETENVNDRININVFDELLVSNPEDPAEIVVKMNKAAPFFWWLGSMKIEAEDKFNILENDYHEWVEIKKSVYDGKKEYGSEAAKERRVIVKYPKTYHKKKDEIRKTKYVLRKIDVARKAYDKAVSLLQSMGAILRDEKQ